MQLKQIWNKQRKCYEWRARFQLRGMEYTPKADTKGELDKLIRAIHSQQETSKLNNKYNLDIPIAQYFPSLEKLLDDVLPTITNKKQFTLSERVFRDFIELLPSGIKVNELATFHFQTYINARKRHIGKQTNEPLKPQTINKELFAISSGLKKAAQFYESLQNWKRPPIPFLPEEDSARELNLEIEKFYLLLSELRNPTLGRQTVVSRSHRLRIADELEFRLETGLRRKEVARLEFKQYIESEGILKNVRRWKTKTVSKIFPLTRRGIEIVEVRRAANPDAKFIFTSDGEPVESDYRTLKNVCADLNIPYGRYTDGGFVPHDLRHQAGTEIVRATDIETAREYLGHSNVNQTTVYLHTDANRLKEAVRRRDEIKQKKTDVEKTIKLLYAEARTGQITEAQFIEKIGKFISF